MTLDTERFRRSDHSSAESVLPSATIVFRILPFDQAPVFSTAKSRFDLRLASMNSVADVRVHDMCTSLQSQQKACDMNEMSTSIYCVWKRPPENRANGDNYKPADAIILGISGQMQVHSTHTYGEPCSAAKDCRRCRYILTCVLSSAG